jgi:AbrB family looped-hinge helix DNA binding protein
MNPRKFFSLSGLDYPWIMVHIYGNCHVTIPLMGFRLSIDKAGRVVLPKAIRDELQLEAGDRLELESSEDRIVLRPLRGSLPLRKKQGIWVFRSEEPISAKAVDEVFKQVRRERDRNNLGRIKSRSKARKKW